MRRSRSESESEQGVQCVVVDPKPGDLPMSRDEGQVTLTGGPNPRTLKSAGMRCG